MAYRLGGVSGGCFSSLNLSFDRGDDPEAVRENFRRIGAAIGVRCEDMVLSKQTHTTNVRVVTEEDRGKGIIRERDYTDVDGLVTDVPGLCLVTSYADCVPLYFVDPVRRVIGLSHSGWRGTVGKIGKKTVQVMQEKFGCEPAELFYEKPDGKFQLDLWKANELIFREAGILPEHMAVTNVCTHCNSKILYSHRTAGDRRGNLCAFLALK